MLHFVYRGELQGLGCCFLDSLRQLANCEHPLFSIGGELCMYIIVDLVQTGSCLFCKERTPVPPSPCPQTTNACFVSVQRIFSIVVLELAESSGVNIIGLVLAGSFSRWCVCRQGMAVTS